MIFIINQITSELKGTPNPYQKIQVEDSNGTAERNSNNLAQDSSRFGHIHEGQIHLY